MIEFLPVSQEERDKLYEANGIPAEAASMGVRLKDGGMDEGYCLFTLLGDICRIDRFRMDTEDALLADGLLRACCSLALNRGGKQAVSENTEDFPLLLSLGFIKSGEKVYLNMAKLLKSCTCH